ncbi:hypothetical protein DL767_009486 [Monosporascus sp. MG133]|nr:hypothetical protein DL767_009486 [Monosporascus sp. MG133]
MSATTRVNSPHECYPEPLVVVSFGPGDPGNPINLSKKKKLFVAGTVCLAMLNSNLSSSLPGGALPAVAEYFQVTDPVAYVLPSTLFLIGYIVGPLVLAPLSEHFGRKPILVCSFTVYLTFTIGCAFAPTFSALVAFRLFAGIGSATPISVIGGVYADIFSDQKTRGQATAAYTVVLGPTVFGFVAIAGWRWCFYVSAIIATVSMVPLALIPETYGPSLLVARARNLRCSSPTCRAATAPLESGNRSLYSILLVAISRPLRMLFCEPIVAFSSIYVSFVFACLFFFFSAYPVIFHGVYGMSHSVAGLAFIPMALGVACSMGIFICYDRLFQNAIEQGCEWARQEGLRRLPLACMGGPLLSVSIFWLGWTASPNIHWSVSMLSGLPFALGMMMIFVAFFNYLTDTYDVYSASALAAASCCRSLWAAFLPMAATPMYRVLGIAWGSSLVGLFSLCLIPVPFVFIRSSERLRKHSGFRHELNGKGEGCPGPVPQQSHQRPGMCH